MGASELGREGRSAKIFNLPTLKHGRFWKEEKTNKYMSDIKRQAYSTGIMFLHIFLFFFYGLKMEAKLKGLAFAKTPC